jgi:hypothetical protein
MRRPYPARRPGAAQVERHAKINSTVIGRDEKPKTRAELSALGELVARG